MARRSPSPEPRHASLTPEQMRTGIARLKKRIEDLEQFHPSKLTKRWVPETTALETAIDQTLGTVFGKGTVEYSLYDRATSLDHGGISMVPNFYGHGGAPNDAHESRQYVAEGKQEALLLLRQAVSGLEESL